MANIDLIVVNNTNTTALEMAAYLAVAKAKNAKVELVTLLKDPEKCAKRNVHGVPLEACKQMDKRIRERKLPPFWKFDSVKEVVND